jgi:hypothetical protein
MAAYIRTVTAEKDRVVVVNSGRIQGRKLSRAERRTTVAHEAGHYVLHWGNKESGQLFFQFTKGPTFCREAECDQSPFNALEYQASALGAASSCHGRTFSVSGKRRPARNPSRRTV